jgi:hypothetical protein
VEWKENIGNSHDKKEADNGRQHKISIALFEEQIRNENKVVDIKESNQKNVGEEITSGSWIIEDIERVHCPWSEQ